MWNTRLDIGGFFTVSDNMWSCGRAIFQGSPASKTNKTSSPFHNNIALEILDQYIKSIRCEEICRWRRIFGSVYMPSINVDRRLLSRRRSHQKFFFQQITVHSIIMMISVVLCKINEEINHVSSFLNHVVRIWLRNRPAKLSWNCNKNS